MQDDRKRVKVGGAEIYYEVCGSGDPLVLVHGLSGSSRWWARNVPVFAQHFRTYTLDLIGFGSSRGSRFALSQASDYLARWMDVLGLGSAHVVGHSMGGYIAADLAADHPDRVHKLVLVDAAALPLGRSYPRNAVGLTQAVLLLPVNFWPILVQDALRAGPVNIASAAYELLSSDLSHKLSAIRSPVLMVWGERDTLVPVSIAMRLHAALPASRLEILRGAGHNPMWDRAEAFNRLALDFLLSDTEAKLASRSGTPLPTGAAGWDLSSS